jgi:catechol 2,3-dioxygenase-like lactoylglutathione lyase family enzyme
MRLQRPGIRVTDLDRSLRFYRRALRLVEVRRGDTRSWGGGIWVLLKDPKGGGILELNWYPKESIFYAPYEPGDALDHIDVTLGVAPRSELERTYRRLLSLGGRPTAITPEASQGWAAGVLDPDGLWIHLGRRPTAAERRQRAAESSPPALRARKSRRRRAPVRGRPR